MNQSRLFPGRSNIYVITSVRTTHAGITDSTDLNMFGGESYYLYYKKSNQSLRHDYYILTWTLGMYPDGDRNSYWYYLQNVNTNNSEMTNQQILQSLVIPKVVTQSGIWPVNTLTASNTDFYGTTLTWTDKNGWMHGSTSSTDRYEIWVSSATEPAYKKHLTISSSSTTPLKQTAKIEDLDPDTQYTFKIKAISGSYSSSLTDARTASATITTVQTLAIDPTDLDVVNTDRIPLTISQELRGNNTNVILTWDASDGEVDCISFFKFQNKNVTSLAVDKVVTNGNAVGNLTYYGYWKGCHTCHLSNTWTS